MKSAWTDKGTRILLAIIAVLLVVNFATTVPGASTPSPVSAGLPDTGAQFERMIEELSKTNKAIDKLQAYLESGKMMVKVEKTDSK